MLLLNVPFLQAILFAFISLLQAPATFYAVPEPTLSPSLQGHYHLAPAKSPFTRANFQDLPSALLLLKALHLFIQWLITGLLTTQAAFLLILCLDPQQEVLPVAPLSLPLAILTTRCPPQVIHHPLLHHRVFFLIEVWYFMEQLLHLYRQYYHLLTQRFCHLDLDYPQCDRDFLKLEVLSHCLSHQLILLFSLSLLISLSNLRHFLPFHFRDSS